MSWMKRGQAGAGAGAQPYAAPQAQPFGNQQNMYPNYQGGTGSAPTQPPQQQQFWQMPPQQPSQQPSQQPPLQQQYKQPQQYSQPYPQDYPPNANQYQPAAQTQYNQNYANQYVSSQQNYPQNLYQNPPAQQNSQQNYTQIAANTGTVNADGWEDNWDWGWEENAKKAQSMQNTPQQPPAQPVSNNANVIEESFVSTDSWNWAMDENKGSTVLAGIQPSRQEHIQPATLHPVEDNVAPQPAHIINNQAEVKTLSDREVIKERLPNLALGKRFHIENLTPQWSIESQMSQESSDGPQTQSDGTYRSENQSRNSGESPGPNTDNSNFNYTQPGCDETYTQNREWSKNSEEPTMADGASHSRRESHEELTNSLQEMSIANDHHSSNGISTHSMVESRSVQDNFSMQSPPASFLAPPVSSSVSVPVMPPPPPVSSVLSQSPQVPLHASLPSLPRPPSSSSTSSAGHPVQGHPSQPPPTSSPAALPPSMPPPSNSQNPFQRAGPFSHKSTTKASSVPAQPFQSQMSSSNLTSPAVVNSVSQSRGPVGFEANLETTPDNSERPDQPQALYRPIPAPQSIPDNMEVAPQNDRNEYLQTAHLSSGDYGENTDFTRNLPPPPGLRRMVVGQQESEYQNLNVSGDEPPPGLSRMVPGQQTEADNAYSQPSDNYMDRHIDGQHMDNAGSARPFRQADGQQNPDSYPQPVNARANDRRPVGFDRMVPGEPSNDEYSQYQGSNYVSNEQRVVTGVDRDFPIPIEASPSDVREQNMDGSDYTESTPRNVIGARDVVNEVTQDFAAPDETQREVTMEGENLQDLSVISSVDLTYSREHLDGADLNITDGGTDRNDAPDPSDRPATSSRKQSLNRVHSSGEDSERDRAFKASPRRDRHKTSRDRDRDRNRDKDKEGRYSRGDRSDRKYERDDRRRDDKRTDKDRRDRDRAREGDASPDARKHRRSTRSRKYDEDDTDYYSDRERDRRRYREGSYTSKPPRGEDRERSARYEDRRDRPRERDRYDRQYNDYRDIDPSRKYGNLHREREEERRRVTFSSDAKSNDSKTEGDAYSSASRPTSREAAATDEETAGARRGPARARRSRHHRPDPYYDGYGAGAGAGTYADPYLVQRQQYEYYEQLRLTDPAAYMLVYQQLMAGHAPPAPLAPLAPAALAPAPAPAVARAGHYAPEGYPGFGYEGRERGSVHSGRSSTTGLKGNDTFYVYRHDASLRDAASLRTDGDVSDRDLTTEASLGLQLEESTARSERMTPFRFSTAHIKGSISSRDVVVVPATYPVDGRPATVQLLALAALSAAELPPAPAPLLKGVTHKKSVIEYCMVRVRNAPLEGARDVIGYVLVWELLALMLRQNGVVVGTDIAELLMKNTKEYEQKSPSNKSPRDESQRESSLSGSLHEETHDYSSPPLSAAHQDHFSLSETLGALGAQGGSACVDEKAALDKYREYLLYGNQQEALEWAMCNNLWGHAMQLAAGMGGGAGAGGAGARRARAGVSARFLAAVPRRDPLHTLYAALHAALPPACVPEERCDSWRPHAAMLLANSTPRADSDLRALAALGDSLASRGQIYCAQFCYVSAGIPFGRHPLAPLPPSPPTPGAATPRLTLLLAEPRPTTLAQLATPRAILATEIYEYARSLNADYVIDELQVYKLVCACRLVDGGLYERALAYVEAAARAVTHAPQLYSRGLVRALAELADRLKYHDPSVRAEGAAGGEEGAESGEGSPRHHWLEDVKSLAQAQVESTSQQVTPQHQYSEPQNQYSWGDQAQQYQQIPNQTYVEPEESTDYPQYYQPNLAPVPTPPDQPSQTADQPSPYAIQTDQPGPYASQADQPSPHSAHVDQPSPYRADQFTGPGAPEESPQYHYEDWSRTEETHSQSYGDYWQGDTGYSYGESGAGAGAGAGPGARPAISMPGGSYAGYDDDRPPSAEHADRADGQRPSADGKDGKSKEVKTDSKGRSWIGGILTKLSLRPPNQMILPDDKNPTIVWDAEHKRWRNTGAAGEADAEGEGEGRAGGEPPPPPPRTAALPSHQPLASASPPLAGAAPVSNIFKMQKGRHIKKSYVDVFNPSGAAPHAPPPAPDALGPAAPPAPLAPHNYFVPAAGPYEAEEDKYPRSGI